MMSKTDQAFETLLAAAARLVRAGQPQFSMTALARAAGLSRSTLYRAFPRRDALLARLRASGVAVSPGGARRRILTAAVRACEELGLRGVTVEEVARRAGVAPVTIYRQFGDRAGLLDAAVQESAPRHVARILALRPSADVEGDLASFAAAALAFAAAHAGVFRMALGATPAEQRQLQKLRQAPRGATAALTKWFAGQIAAGRIADHDPHELAVAFLGMLINFAYVAPIFEDMPLEDPNATGRTLARLFLRGAATARGRRG